MPADPDDELDEGPFRTPLPQDDRIWRHPSELDEDGAVRSSVTRWIHTFFRRSSPYSGRELRKKG